MVLLDQDTVHPHDHQSSSIDAHHQQQQHHDQNQNQNQNHSHSPLPQRSANALNLLWSFGINKNILGGVHNLSDGTREALFYAAAHTGVIYDFQRGKQKVLKGHSNHITATTLSADKRWAATCDVGDSSMIIVWDTHSGMPVKTLFDPHHGTGVVAMEMSGNAKYLVTLGADAPQTLCIWEWATGSDTPLHTVVIPGDAADLQTCVRFNPEDVYDIICNGETSVHFIVWELPNVIGATAVIASPVLNHKEFHHEKPKFTYSAFIPSTAQACTATTSGDVVVWSDRSLENLSSVKSKEEKTAIKIVKLHNAAINFISGVGKKHIVTGGEDGHVKFYDLQFRLATSFERLKSGGITSVAFSTNLKLPDGNTEAITEDVDVPEFVATTRQAKCFLVSANPASSTIPLTSVILQGQSGCVRAVVAHPNKHQFAVSGESGLIQIWDYDTKSIVSQHRFTEAGVEVTALAFSPDGNKIAAGLSNGAIKIFRCETALQEVRNSNITLSKDVRITKIAWSPEADHLATADSTHSVGMFYLKHGADHHTTSSEKGEETWTYVGRFNAHTENIIGVSFSIDREDRSLHLHSVSEDRHIVEYDIAKSTVVEGVKIKWRKALDQVSKPLAVCAHPRLGDEDFMLFTNSAMKFRLHNASTFMCRGTRSAPTSGGTIHSMQVVPKIDGDDKNSYLAYGTREKMVGLVKFPLDGNPHKSMGLVAHPGEVTALACACDGKYLLTGGGMDSTVQFWSIDTNVLEAQASLGGEGMRPFLEILAEGDPTLSENPSTSPAKSSSRPSSHASSSSDGGGANSNKSTPSTPATSRARIAQLRECAPYREMEDYFYYAQLRTQGEDNTNIRKISERLTVKEVAPIMQAIGFYPSDQQIEDMANEIRFTNLLAGITETESLTFDELIKLYLNHRPVCPITREAIAESLSASNKTHNRGSSLSVAEAEERRTQPLELQTFTKKRLFDLLQQYGEPMEEREFERLFEVLLKETEYDGSLPATFGLDEYVQDILGFGVAAGGDDE